MFSKNMPRKKEDADNSDLYQVLYRIWGNQNEVQQNNSELVSKAYQRRYGFIDSAFPGKSSDTCCWFYTPSLVNIFYTESGIYMNKK